MVRSTARWSGAYNGSPDGSLNWRKARIRATGFGSPRIPRVSPPPAIEFAMKLDDAKRPVSCGSTIRSMGQYVGKGLHPQVAETTIAQVLSHSAGLTRDGADAGQFSDRRPYLNHKELLEPEYSRKSSAGETVDEDFFTPTPCPVCKLCTSCGSATARHSLRQHPFQYLRRSARRSDFSSQRAWIVNAIELTSPSTDRWRRSGSL